MLHEDRNRAMSFGAAPGLYHATRPSYPAELVDALVPRAPVEVLDVGCGTGIAALQFRDRGCGVLGVEADERMARFARSLGLAVEVATFEDWAPGARRFDLVISGQAWHWVDPHRGARAAAAVLRPGGTVGLFWNRAVHPPEIREAFDSIYRDKAPSLEDYSIVLGHGTGDRFAVAEAGLAAEGSFESVERRTYSWERSYTAAHWRDHLLTHSDHQALPDEQRDQLLDAVTAAIDEWGGGFTTGYETVLISARRR